jgi:hypothetical protein
MTGDFGIMCFNAKFKTTGKSLTSDFSAFRTTGKQGENELERSSNLEFQVGKSGLFLELQREDQ